MKILFTGASSFTGMHFIEALLLEGHEVLAVFSRPMEAYTGISQVRMKRIQKKHPVFLERSTERNHLWTCWRITTLMCTAITGLIQQTIKN